MQKNVSQSNVSRRSFLAVTGVAAAACMSESMLACFAAKRLPAAVSGDVLINANENPLGPCDSARTAISEATAYAGRYRFELANELVNNFAHSEGLSSDQIAAFAGSGEPLHYTVLAFTSPKAPLVYADPTYEPSYEATKVSGARAIPVPLTSTYAHDVRAMVAAAPDAGLYYICSPNNPTGTLTPHSDIEYLLEHKPKNAVVLVDEAYLHFADAPSTLDLVKADKDIVVLRTFSKIYGMAGMRMGFAVARPDLLEKVARLGGQNPLPVLSCAAAIASLNNSSLVIDRRRINTSTREQTFEWLRKNGYSFIPSVSNCFLLDAGRPGREMMNAMAARGVHVGRVWQKYPTHVRITVGTPEEMQKFQTAWNEAMKDKSQVGWTREPRTIFDERGRNA